MLISNIDANIFKHNKLLKKTVLTIFHMHVSKCTQCWQNWRIEAVYATI